MALEFRDLGTQGVELGQQFPVTGPQSVELGDGLGFLLSGFFELSGKFGLAVPRCLQLRALRFEAGSDIRQLVLEVLHRAQMFRRFARLVSVLLAERLQFRLEGIALLLNALELTFKPPCFAGVVSFEFRSLPLDFLELGNTFGTQLLGDPLALD